MGLHIHRGIDDLKNEVEATDGGFIKNVRQTGSTMLEKTNTLLNHPFRLVRIGTKFALAIGGVLIALPAAVANNIDHNGNDNNPYGGSVSPDIMKVLSNAVAVGQQDTMPSKVKPDREFIREHANATSDTHICQGPIEVPNSESVANRTSSCTFEDVELKLGKYNIIFHLPNEESQKDTTMIKDMVEAYEERFNDQVDESGKVVTGEADFVAKFVESDIPTNQYANNTPSQDIFNDIVRNIIPDTDSKYNKDNISYYGDFNVFMSKKTKSGVASCIKNITDKNPNSRLAVVGYNDLDQEGMYKVFIHEIFGHLLGLQHTEYQATCPDKHDTAHAVSDTTFVFPGSGTIIEAANYMHAGTPAGRTDQMATGPLTRITANFADGSAYEINCGNQDQLEVALRNFSLITCEKEQSYGPDKCGDGIDNDGDGLIDNGPTPETSITTAPYMSETDQGSISINVDEDSDSGTFEIVVINTDNGTSVYTDNGFEGGSFSVNKLLPGAYSVSVKNEATDCTTTNYIDIEDMSSTGTIDIGSKSVELSIYPNPVKDELNIELAKTEGAIVNYTKVIDASGKIAHESDEEFDVSTINTSGWLPGMYLVQVIVTLDGKWESVTQKIIK